MATVHDLKLADDALAHFSLCFDMDDLSDALEVNLNSIPR
jgi:hypothetical protein